MTLQVLAFQKETLSQLWKNGVHLRSIAASSEENRELLGLIHRIMRLLFMYTSKNVPTFSFIME